ncbi:YozE family protein [Lysinibacillus sp.]|uniref:YozE family protein n=1 Tax=Lysinibacillus sp. TaxID=1869345 RepID=UPI0028A9B966|nr:YozE family protein [Lysinibacillus sp.]
MTFKNWLLNHSDYSKYGQLAVDIEGDKTFPNTESRLEIMVYLIGSNAGESAFRMFSEAWEEYVTECNKVVSQ